MNNSITNTESISVRRELIAFAFVEESYSKTGDIISGLVPLFAPILAPRANRIFDSAQFAKDVQTAYDIPMSPLVADGLVERLAEAGLLRLETGDSHTYRINATSAATQTSDETQVDRLLSDFCRFATAALSRVQLSATNDELQIALLKRLTTAYFLSFVDRREKNYFKGNTISLKKVEDDERDAIHLEQALDVVCAEFALQKMGEGEQSAEFLLRMVSGALIAEVVLTLQTPSSGELLEKLSVIVDGPLILDYLDLSSPELRDYAKDLFEIIKKAGLRRVVFKHTVDEIKGTVQGPLKALQRGEEPFGPLGIRLRTNVQHAAYARAIHDDLENKLIEIGFEVMDANDYLLEDRFKFCTPQIEESLRNNIGSVMFNLERRIRDALSVATVLRLRGELQRKTSIAGTEWILITRNDAVANRSQGFLEGRKVINRDEVPPAITDRRLAGYLWFAVGGSIGALSRQKLVANCTYVMTPRTDVVSKARQYLCDLDPAKADVFAALMRDQRAQRCLMRNTLGFPSAIRKDNAEQLLEELRLSVASEIQENADVRERELTTRHETKITEMAVARQAEQLEDASALLLLKQELAKEKAQAHREIQLRDERAKLLSDRLTSIEGSLGSDIQRRIQMAVNGANLSKKILKFGIGCIYLILVAAAYWFLPNEKVPYALIVTMVLALAAFWIVPQFVYDRIAKPLWLHQFNSRCHDLGVADHLDEYALDPLSGSAVPKLVETSNLGPYSGSDCN
jgi:hypothetical protein